MDLGLYVKEGDKCKFLEVPVYIVRDLLRDRLSRSEIARIHRFAEPIDQPPIFKVGSVVIDFGNKTARCFQTKINVDDLEPTWKVVVEDTTLFNYA